LNGKYLYLIFFSSTVCANHPEAWVPNQVQGGACVSLGFIFLFSLCPLLMDCSDKQDFKIQNMVASCDVNFPIRLEGLAFSHGAFSNVSLHVLPNVQQVGFGYPCHIVHHSTTGWIWVSLSYSSSCQLSQKTDRKKIKICN
jgi:hypothetical protein